MISPCKSEDVGAGGETPPELLRKRRYRSFCESERSQAARGESNRHPSGVSDVQPNSFGSAHFANKAVQPRASSCPRTKRQELISRCPRRRPRHEEVLNIIEFQ